MKLLMSIGLIAIGSLMVGLGFTVVDSFFMTFFGGAIAGMGLGILARRR